MPTFSDPATGWSFTYATAASGAPPDGGLALTDITHDQHRFARDLRVVAVLLRIEEVDASGAVTSTTMTRLPLVEAASVTVSPVRELRPTSRTVMTSQVVPWAMAPVRRPATWHELPEADEALNFESYFGAPHNRSGCGVRADYVFSSALFDQAGLQNMRWYNRSFASIELSQRFLFSGYGLSPPHEPNSVLPAARCHPLVRYRVTPNPSFDPTRPHLRLAGIRFDYRIHYNLDRHHDVTTNRGLPQLGNQAGLFLDHMMISPVFGAAALVGRVLNTALQQAATSALTFLAAEKPLIYEVWTELSDRGASRALSAGFAPCWDNLHWWSARGPGQPLISAPGGFHCAHMHLRWGTLGQTGRAIAPQFDPTAVPASARHPLIGVQGQRNLVDPNAWIQTVKIAIAHNDAALDPNQGAALTTLTRAHWERLFTEQRAQPLDISAGDDLALWYSTEVHASVDLPAVTSSAGAHGASRFVQPLTTGTVFLHGIFFAHNAEPTSPPLGGGSTGPEYFPLDEATIRANQDWHRLPYFS